MIVEKFASFITSIKGKSNISLTKMFGTHTLGLISINTHKPIKFNYKIKCIYIAALEKVFRKRKSSACCTQYAQYFVNMGVRGGADS